MFCKLPTFMFIMVINVDKECKCTCT